MPKFSHNRADNLSHPDADSEGKKTQGKLSNYVVSEAAAVIFVLWLSRAGPKGPNPSVQNCGYPLEGSRERQLPG